MDKVKNGINNYLTPILITVIGFFLAQTLLEIKDDIASLVDRNVKRDEWIREWTEDWQPTLNWAKRQMERENR